MKKAIKKYLTQLHENEEKGFSLVELIIVMAIMAILVGVVASQVIPYMEKSRQSKDQQQLSGLATDITSALASSGQTAQNVGTATAGVDITTGIGALGGGAGTTAGDKIIEEFVSLRDTTGSMTLSEAIVGVQEKLKSKAANIKVTAGTPPTVSADKTAVAKKISDSKIYMIYDTATSKLTLFMGSDANPGNAVSKLTVESE